jgi:hypothetical protein
MAKSFDALVKRTTSKRTGKRAALRTRELLGELLLSEVRKLPFKHHLLRQISCQLQE